MEGYRPFLQVIRMLCGHETSMFLHQGSVGGRTTGSTSGQSLRIQKPLILKQGVNEWEAFYY
jgi:hypothetical protein